MVKYYSARPRLGGLLLAQSSFPALAWTRLPYDTKRGGKGEGCKESELEEFEHSISDLEYNWYLHTV